MSQANCFRKSFVCDYVIGVCVMFVSYATSRVEMISLNEGIRS